MARIRSIHPGFFTDEDLVSVSAFARLLVIGLGVQADDKGIFEWKPLMLKMRIFPGDNVEVSDLLSELAEANCIAMYEMNGRKYGAIRNFRKHQRPKTPNDVHPIPNDFRNYVGLTDPISEMEAVKPKPFPPKGEKPPQMEDGGDKMEDEGCSKTLAQKPDFDLEFEKTFWPQYPRKKDKAKSLKAFHTARKTTELSVIMAGLLRYAAERDEQDQKFTKHASSWLNGECWLNETDPEPPKTKSKTLKALKGLNGYADKGLGKGEADFRQEIEGTSRQIVNA